MRLTLLYEDVKKLKWWQKMAVPAAMAAGVAGITAKHKDLPDRSQASVATSDLRTAYNKPSNISEYEPEEVPRQEEEPKTQEQEKAPARPQAQSGFPIHEFISDLIQHEGKRNKAYNDGRGNITVGVGHYMKNSREIFKELFGKDVDFDEVLKGKQNLTDNQVVKLAVYDVKKHIKRAQKMFPGLYDLPGYLQAAIVDGVYRGQFEPNGETAKAINSRNWPKVVRLLINRKDYKAASRPNAKGRMGGVKSRIDDLIVAIKRHIEESQEVAGR